MEIFISWSGQISQAIAEELYNWLPKVLQFVKPYFTPNDIEKGVKWENEINKKLEECSLGIICLTIENTEKPWILFEAGALSNKLNKSRVCPVLFGINNTDLTGPLATFQTTCFDKTEFKKLMMTINNQAGISKVSDEIFEDVFDTFFPRLEKNIKFILTSKKIDSDIRQSTKRTDRDLLEEILDLTRIQHNFLPFKAKYILNSNPEHVHIDISDFTDGKAMELLISNISNFRELLDEIYYKLSNWIKPFTYEYDWILIDRESKKAFKSIVINNNIPKGNPFYDNRTLSQVGIEPGMFLKVKKI